jgi:hypothetical protein
MAVEKARRLSRAPATVRPRTADMTDRALGTLTAAWTATMLVTTLLAATVALSRVWDSAVYLQALQRVFYLNV